MTAPLISPNENYDEGYVRFRGKEENTTTCPDCGLPEGHALTCASRELHIVDMPAPRRTDFKTWQRDTLEKFAREVADENKVLRACIFQLENKA